MSQSKGSRNPADIKAAALEAYATSGLSLADVADAFDVSVKTLGNWRRKAGLVPPRVKHIGPPTCHPTRPLHARGMCRACYLRAWARTRGTV